MSSPSTVLTQGLGSWSTVNLLITGGLSPNLNFPVYNANGSYYLDIGSKLSIMLGGPAMPSWNTVGRPATPKSFAYGFNTDTSKLELWNGVSWVGVLLS